jgi:hypothetical protein
MHSFSIPKDSFPYGFPFCSETPPHLNACKTVLTHSKPLEFNMGYSHDGLKEMGVLTISKTVSIERKVQWECEEDKQEYDDLCAMSIKEAREWLQENTFRDVDGKTDEDIETLRQESAEEIINEGRYETVVVTSTNGKYTLDDLAKAVYYGARSFEGFNENEMVYEIQVDVKSNQLYYSSNT